MFALSKDEPGGNGNAERPSPKRYYPKGDTLGPSGGESPKKKRRRSGPQTAESSALSFPNSRACRLRAPWCLARRVPKFLSAAGCRTRAWWRMTTFLKAEPGGLPWATCGRRPSLRGGGERPARLQDIVPWAHVAGGPGGGRCQPETIRGQWTWPRYAVMGVDRLELAYPNRWYVEAYDTVHRAYVVYPDGRMYRRETWEASPCTLR